MTEFETRDFRVKFGSDDGFKVGFMSDDNFEVDFGIQKDGRDANFVYVQETAEEIWNIRHNLGKMPSITVIDSAGSVVQGEYEIIDINTIRIAFSAPFAGKAILN